MPTAAILNVGVPDHPQLKSRIHHLCVVHTETGAVFAPDEQQLQFAADDIVADLHLALAIQAMSPSADILAIRLDRRDRTVLDALIDGIGAAWRAGATVILTPVVTRCRVEDPRLTRCLAEARSHGSLVVAASGGLMRRSYPGDACGSLSVMSKPASEPEVFWYIDPQRYEGSHHFGEVLGRYFAVGRLGELDEGVDLAAAVFAGIVCEVCKQTDTTGVELEMAVRQRAASASI